MNSVEGRIEDLQGENLLLESECGKDKPRTRGKSHDTSELSDLFWIAKPKGTNSASRTMKQKWKHNPQDGNTTSNFDKEISDADSGESNWRDLPMELLVRILALVDHRTIIVASGVCTGWRDAIRMGVFELSFSWCRVNTSKLVQSVAPKFTRLQVCNLNLPYDPLSLNDLAVESLACHCHDLRALDLSNGTRLTDSSIFALALGCGRLERLNLSGCIAVTELGLTVLAENCSNLTHLNLYGCDNAGSDQILLAFARNCVGLQVLNLGWCVRISDTGITGLALWCSDLRVIDLCGCFLVTDRSVIALADKCHHLRALGLYSCKNITDTAMYALANSCKYGVLKGKPKRNSTHYNSNYMAQSAVTRSSTGSCSTSSNSSCSSCSSNNEMYTVNIRHYLESLLNDQEDYGLLSLNLGMCINLSGQAVQAVCDAFPGLHTCDERRSLNISGCQNLNSVHCICVIKARQKRRNWTAYRLRLLNQRHDAM